MINTSPKPVDKRILRSKNLLYQALLSLLEQKEYKDICVKDLTEKADVARPTFYRNFKTIDDILIDEMDVIFEEYYEFIEKKMVEGKFYDSTIKLFELLMNNRVLFGAMYKADLSYKILDRFDQYAIRIKKSVLNPEKLTLKSRYSAHFFAGGCFLVFTKWLEHNMKSPTTELIELVNKYFEHLVLSK